VIATWHVNSWMACASAAYKYGSRLTRFGQEHYGRQEIVSGLDGCSHFLVILSHAALQSEWVLEEIKLARARFDRDPSFLVLQLVTGKLSAPLSDLQQVPYLDEFVDQLKAVLKAGDSSPEASRPGSCRSRFRRPRREVQRRLTLAGSFTRGARLTW
jgi:hypothetical protein